MARAKKFNRTISKVVKTEEPMIELNLTIAEAKALKQILDQVGGDPYRSKRLYVDRIETALISVDINATYEENRDAFTTKDSLYFVNNSADRSDWRELPSWHKVNPQFNSKVHIKAAVETVEPFKAEAVADTVIGDYFKKTPAHSNWYP